MTEHPDLPGSLFCHLQLGPEQLARLSPRRVAALSVESGRAWITRHGEAKDLILGPGQRLSLSDDGAPLLVSGFDNERTTVLRVEFRVPASDWRLRLARRLLLPRAPPDRSLAMNARQPCDDFRLLSSNPLVRLDGGDANLSFKVGKRHLNGAGTLHGGVLASVFDSALGECVYRQAQHSGRPAALVVTTQLDIHYCAPAHVGERVALAVEVLRLGGRLAVATARASVAERLVGTATGSFYLTR